MITENLSTLKINKLSQAQYNRELAAGNIAENEIYLTPEEELDMSQYATVNQLNTKADSDHNHDDAYDSKGAADTALSSANSYTDTKLGNIDDLNTEHKDNLVDAISEINEKHDTKHVSNVSLLSITENGKYYVDNATDAPDGATTSGYLDVHTHNEQNTTYRVVEFTPYDNTGKFYNICMGGTWSGWKKFTVSTDLSKYVQLGDHPYFTGVWLGDSTSAVPYIYQQNGILWFRWANESGTTQFNSIESITNGSRIKTYSSWADLGLDHTTANIENIIDAMANGSIAILHTESGSNTVLSPSENNINGTIIIHKYSNSRSMLIFETATGGKMYQMSYYKSYDGTVNASSWKKVITADDFSLSGTTLTITTT